jgi:hypothetical protein
MREPVGVIGLLAPDDAPLLGAVSLLAPAIAMGNRVVLVPSWPAPLAATDLYQVLDTSDVPGGVVNIVTGDPGELGGTLASHLDVDALWSFSPRVDAGRSRPPRQETSSAPGSTTAATRTGCRPRAGDGASSTPRPRSRRSGCPTASEGRRSPRGKRTGNAGISKRKTRVFRRLNGDRRPSPSSWPSAPRARPRRVDHPVLEPLPDAPGHEDDKHHAQQDHDVEPREQRTSGPATGRIVTALG